MISADRTLIAPTPSELQATLNEVVNAANATATTGQLSVTPALVERIVRRMAEHPQGDAVWHDVGEGAAAGAYTGLRTVWVADYRQRRHVRLQTLRRYFTGATSDDSFVFPNADRSPAELVYERHVYRFVPGLDGAPVVLVGCACGAISTPGGIAWMGDRCGPCHDRTESGDPLPEPLVRHDRAPLAIVEAAGATDRLVGRRVVGRPLACFSDGDRLLVLRNNYAREGGTTHELVYWSLPDQRQLACWPLTSNNLGVHLNADNSRLGLLAPRADGILLRLLAWPEYRELVQVAIPGTPRCFTLAPQADMAYVGNDGQLVAVDLTRPQPTCTPLPLPKARLDPLDLSCSPDGRWLAVCWHDGEVVLYDRRKKKPGPTLTLPGITRRAVLVFPPDGEFLLVCDEQAGIWFCAMPTLEPLGRFQAESLTINGLDVCGLWLMLLPLEDAPLRCWPWQVLREYARAVARRKPA
jgi:hypothetical protein